MADPVEYPAGPPPDRSLGALRVDLGAPGADGPVEDGVEEPGEDVSAGASESPGLPPPEPPAPAPTSHPAEPLPPGASGRYRRLIVAAVVAALAVPAASGAS